MNYTVKSINTMKKFTLLTLMMLVTLATQAQSYSFRVLASNGKVLSKANNKRLWAGSTVKSTDQIVLAPNAYLGLIHTNGKTIELKKAGTYKVSTLAAKVSGRQSSTTAKYVDRKSTRLNSSHSQQSRMPSSA